MVQPCPRHFDPIGQHEGALKRPCGNAAVQEHPVGAVIALSATDHQLAILDRDGEVFLAKTCDGQCDAIGVVRGRLDVEGGIAFGGGFGGAFDQSFQLFKPQQERVSTKAEFRHDPCP